MSDQTEERARRALDAEALRVIRRNTAGARLWKYRNALELPVQRCTPNRRRVR